MQANSENMIDDDPRIELSVERTELALERTFLAWIRTVIALITSGFAIDQLVEAFRAGRLISGHALLKQAHVTGLVLTITGTVLMAVMAVYYVRRYRVLVKMRKGKPERLPSGIALSVVVFIVGITLVYLVAVSP